MRVAALLQLYMTDCVQRTIYHVQLMVMMSLLYSATVGILLAISFNF